jgi:exopolysaccharide/PEP-CTERM locus tyrosine autokinase
MGLIEQAAKRLEELRRAGIEVPDNLDQRQPGVRAINPRAAVDAPPAGRPRSPALQLDLARLASQGFVTPDMPRTHIADEFRVIKRPLIANAAGKGTAPVKHGNLIMVTSAVPGEGKTFSSVNLAMSIAMEQDRTVLLVDADVARPMLPTTLGVPEGRGMLDLLENPSIDFGEVLHRTNVERLTFLSSGKPHPRAAEMLASDAMSALLHDLATRYADRIVIFDSPPLLVTTEARVLASRVGQVVLVVSAESTLQADVTRALATIEACPVKMMVLNKARTTGQGAYGYGYGYGYGN